MLVTNSPGRKTSIKYIPGEFQGHQVGTWLEEYKQGGEWEIHNGFREARFLGE